jgi:hypothetical protein
MNGAQPHHSPHALAAAIAILIAASALSKLNGVLTEAIFALMIVSALAFTPFKTDLSKTKTFFLYFIIACSIMATAMQMNDGVDVSIRQLSRTSIWAALYMLILLVGQQIFDGITTPRLQFIYTTARILVILVAALVLADLTTGLEISPAVIRVKEEGLSGQRIYITASSAIAPLFFLYLWRLDLLPLLATIVIIAASQGKAMLAAIPIALIVFGIRRPKAGALSFLVIMPFALLLAPTDRLTEFIEAGDLQRLRQINEAWEIYTSNALNILIGAGHGTPYSEGYAQFGGSNAEQANLYENSRYDVENGFIYLLLRFGAVGLIVFFILTFRTIQHTDSRRAFILNTLFVCAASSFFATPGGIFFVCCFCMVSTMLSRLAPTQ